VPVSNILRSISRLWFGIIFMISTEVGYSSPLWVGLILDKGDSRTGYADDRCLPQYYAFVILQIVALIDVLC
jgi:hypothetical protein